MNPEEVGTTPQTTHNPVVMAEELRTELKRVEMMTREFAEILKSPNTTPLFDKGEVIANCMLALRHIEDARMRFGKCIQYSEVKNNGESCYAK